MSVQDIDPVKVARTVSGYLQDAMGDIASDMLNPHGVCHDDKWTKKIKKAKKNGVRDMQGWLADELYNDPDILSDLMGDKIHDEVGGNEEKFQAVLDELAKGAHPALLKACKSLQRKPAKAAVS